MFKHFYPAHVRTSRNYSRFWLTCFGPDFCRLEIWCARTKRLASTRSMMALLVLVTFTGHFSYRFCNLLARSKSGENTEFLKKIWNSAAKLLCWEPLRWVCMATVRPHSKICWSDYFDCHEGFFYYRGSSSSFSNILWVYLSVLTSNDAPKRSGGLIRVTSPHPSNSSIEAIPIPSLCGNALTSVPIYWHILCAVSRITWHYRPPEVCVFLCFYTYISIHVFLRDF